MAGDKLVVEAAARERLPLKLLLSGPPGSGKTLGSLIIAKGFLPEEDLEHVYLIDTEKRASLEYADIFGAQRWKMIEVDPPYDPRRGAEAIELATKAGAKLIILDSLYHFWHGEGGLLWLKEEIVKSPKFKKEYGGNEFAVWNILNPIHNALIQKAILLSDTHIICTCRSEMEYVLTEDPNTGRKRPTKLGLAPKQRKGLEYEFRAHFEIDGDNYTKISKGSMRLRKAVGESEFKISEATGKGLREWLSEETGDSGGSSASSPPPEPAD